MFPDAFLELVPPRPPSPAPQPARNHAVELPDDVLRLIFEIAVAGDRRTARTLLSTAKWVHEWIARSVYTTLYIRTRAGLLALLRVPDRDLALVRNLWVRARSPFLTALLERMPNLERLAMSLSAARKYGWAGIRDRTTVRSVFPPSMRLREFELINPETGRAPPFMFCYEFNTLAFQAVTHMRLEFLRLEEAIRLGDPGFYGTLVSVVPRLTHLAFDVRCSPSGPFEVGSGSPHAGNLRKILLSPERTALRRLVYVVPAAEDCDAHTRAKDLLALRLPRLVVLVEPFDVTARRLDWKARTLGQAGFWERAELLGLTCAEE